MCVRCWTMRPLSWPPEAEQRLPAAATATVCGLEWLCATPDIRCEALRHLLPRCAGKREQKVEPLLRCFLAFDVGAATRLRCRIGNRCGAHRRRAPSVRRNGANVPEGRSFLGPRKRTSAFGCDGFPWRTAIWQPAGKKSGQGPHSKPESSAEWARAGSDAIASIGPSIRATLCVDSEHPLPPNGTALSCTKRRFPLGTDNGQTWMSWLDG